MNKCERINTQRHITAIDNVMNNTRYNVATKNAIRVERVNGETYNRHTTQVLLRESQSRTYPREREKKRKVDWQGE
jgi:hypothetical protein